MLQDVDAVYVLFLFHVVDRLNESEQFRPSFHKSRRNCLLLAQLIFDKTFFPSPLNSQRICD